jgi:hypothetical protein
VAYVGFLAIATGLGLLIEIVRRRGHGRVLEIIIPVFATLWLLAILMVSQGWEESNGISDCWPRCNAWQDILFWLVWGGAVLMAAVVISLLVRLIRRR